MLIWTNRNTEDGVGDNNYYFKENYWEMRNQYFQTKKKIRTNNSGIMWNLRKSQKVITETFFFFSKYNLKCLS